MNMKMFIKSLTRIELTELWDVISNESFFEDLIIAKTEKLNNVTIEDFFLKYEKEMTARLKTVLVCYIGPYHNRLSNAYKKLSDINVEEFKTIRNCGQKSIDEFIKLRGY